VSLAGRRRPYEVESRQVCIQCVTEDKLEWEAGLRLNVASDDFESRIGQASAGAAGAAIQVERLEDVKHDGA
jgi:hypothetical protein